MQEKSEYQLKATKNPLKYVSVITFLLVLLTNNCFGQSITWQRTYDGPAHYSDRVYSVTLADNNNFYAVGSTIVSGFYHYIMKLNELGDTIWTRKFQPNPPYGSFSYSSVSDGTGGIVITGDSDTSFTMRLDKNGNTIWYKNYNTLYTTCFSIIKKNDGGFIACGKKFSSNNYGYVINTDSLGNLLWQKLFPSTGSKNYGDLIETNNSFYITGTVTDAIVDTQQVLLTKLNYSGDVQWEKRYTIFGRNGNGAKIIQISNRLLISGNTIDSILLQGRGYFIITDTTGNLLYTKIFQTSKSERLHDVLVLNDNKLLFTLLRDSVNGLKISRVIITDSTGNILQERFFIPPEREGYIEFESIMRANNGDFIFGGYSQLDTNISHEDIYIARTDSLLYAPPIGIINEIEESPRVFLIYPPFPNPFNPTTNIKYEIPNDAKVSIKVYDLLGREVFSVNEYKQAGSHEVMFDGSNLASGLYFYSLKAETSQRDVFTETKKMVLIK